MPILPIGRRRIEVCSAPLASKMIDAGEALPSLAVVVVNWNKANLLRDCLQSLSAQTTPVEIIVVDNGSTDESESVASEFHATWLPMGRNVGLAPAFNVGAETAKSTHLAFLNNDVAVGADFAEQCLARFHTPGRNLGALDVAHFNWEESAPTHRRTLLRTSADDLVTAGFEEVDADDMVPCAFASGACFVISRSLFEAVGRWDAGFFAGWEDVDLSWRVRSAGFDVFYDPSIRIRHRVSASSENSEGHRVRTYAAMTGRVRFAVKHAPRRIVVACVARLVFGFVADVVRNPRRLPLRMRAVIETTRELPSLLKWRRNAHQSIGTSVESLWSNTLAIA